MRTISRATIVGFALSTLLLLPASALAEPFPAGASERRLDLEAARLTVFAYRPACRNPSLLLVFHGQNHNADDYRDWARPLADKHCMLVVAPSLGIPLQMGITALALCLVAVVVRDDRRRMGMFVNGYRRGATRPVALAIAGVTIVLLMAQIEARDHGLSIATRAGIAALEFIVATAGSVMWQRAFVRELRKQSS